MIKKNEECGNANNCPDLYLCKNGKPLDDIVAGHNVVNMAATYNIIKGNPVLGNLDFTLKLNNILNTEYAEIPGFAGDGFTFLAGIRSTY